MKIYAPVNDFNGLRNNVRFVNGVGETDDPQLIEWFKSHGYTVEKCEIYHENAIEKSVEKNESLRVETLPTAHESEPEMMDNGNHPDSKSKNEVEVMGYPEQDFEAMTPNELREWAIENGLGSKIRNTRNKEKLLEIIKG